ncbi:putative glycosyltransferase EpsE [compost metagenome]
MRPTISVLIPAYNAQSTLKEAIASVLSQSQPADQIVVVNDGSKDGTAAIIDSFQGEPTFEGCHLSENKGFVGALNYGLSRCTGEWVVRLDADDWWDDNHLAEILHVVSTPENQAYSMIGLRARYIDEQGSDLGLSPGPLNHKEARRFLVKDNPFVHSGVAFRRKAAMSLGGYSETSRWKGGFEDYELWIALASVGNVAVLPQVTVNYLKTQGSLSSIRKHESLRDRFVLQRKAWVRFWKQGPVRSTVILVASWARLAFMQKS